MNTLFLGKYLTVEETEARRKTRVWQVRSKNHGDVLGEIKWFGRWRQYCFFPEPKTIFNPECMDHISAFCWSMTKQHRASVEVER